MEKEDPPGGSQCEPCHSKIYIHHSEVKLVGSAKKIDSSFNNEGNGNQSFDHAGILGSSRGNNSRSQSGGKNGLIANNRFHPTPSKNMLDEDYSRVLNNPGPYNNNFAPHPPSRPGSYNKFALQPRPSLGRNNNFALQPHPNLGPHNNFSTLRPPSLPLFAATHGSHFDPDDDEESDSSEDSDEDSSSSDSDVEERKYYVDVYLEYLRSKNSYVTIVQGLKPGNGFYLKILNSLRTEFGCEGQIAQDQDFEWVIKLFGDRVTVVCNFLVRMGIIEREYIRIHRLGGLNQQLAI